MAEKKLPLLKIALVPVIFELCGLIPLALAVLGATSIATAISLRNLLVYRYSFAFFIAAAAFFIVATYMHLKSKNQCSIEGLSENRPGIALFFILLFFVQAALLLFIRLSENLVYGEPLTNLFDFAGIGGFILLCLAVFLAITFRK